MSSKDLQFGLTGIAGRNARIGIPVARSAVGDLAPIGPDYAQENAERLRDDVAGLLGPSKEALTRRVTRRCAAMAAQLPVDQAAVQRLTLAAQLHRVGELCLPAALTRKCFLDMNSRELEVYGQCPVYSTLFLTDGRAGNPFFDLMLSHREYVSGAGFPLGAEARRVPLEARVLCVATEYEELMLHRGGTPAKDDTILRFMMSNLSWRYESELVDLLLATIADDNGRH